jgi:hypothetical protein
MRDRALRDHTYQMRAREVNQALQDYEPAELERVESRGTTRDDALVFEEKK